MSQIEDKIEPGDVVQVDPEKSFDIGHCLVVVESADEKLVEGNLYLKEKRLESVRISRDWVRKIGTAAWIR